MIRISVLYPAGANTRFDYTYYTQKHMPMVQDRLKSLGLVRWEVDRGVGGGAPGAAAPFACIGHLYFNSVADFQNGMGKHGKEFMADIPNYTDIQPQIQVSEVIA
jgi:uncharacterized protein (TIGR02118 family)